MAHKVEELPLYQEATVFAAAVIDMLSRPAFSHDRELWKEISDANDSITANISEGFEQATDELFIKYLYYSKGSLREVVDRLGQARRKSYITGQELISTTERADALGRRLGGFIKYLAKSNFRNRGRHQVMEQRKLPNKPLE